MASLYTFRCTRSNSGVTTSKAVSKDASKNNQKPSSMKKVQKLKTDGDKISKRNFVPSSGYIGKTRFDLLIPLFKSRLPKELDLDLKALLDQTIQAHDTLIMHHGVIGGTSKWKAITQYAIGLLEGRNPENPGWVAVGRTNKWPKRIRHLLPLYVFVKDNISNEAYHEDINEVYRFICTLFKLNRVCTANSELLPLLENIGKRSRLEPDTVNKFEQYVRTRLAEIRESITITDLDIKLFLGPSNGPNRGPKLKFSLEEAAVLAKDKVLHEAFHKYCEVTGNLEFYGFFSQCAKKYSELPSKLTDIKLRKLTAIPDKANKSRVIAICDLWTQSVLAPLEDSVIDITARLFKNNLAFFDHREGWDTIRSLPQSVLGRCVSLDASSWTDNFPASLQYIVVKALYGESLSKCWKTLAIDCPWYVPNMPRPVHFGKGQGMGTKASFAIAQLTDLLFVEFELQRIYGDSSGHFFMKVGDDLVVEDPELKLSSRYEAIGVPINLTKSKFKTEFGIFQEFVSRNLWNSYDYSIVSPGLISKFLRNSYYSLTLYHHVAERMKGAPTILDWIEYKKEVLSSKENFSLEKYQARSDRLMKVINLLIVGYKLDPSIMGPSYKISFDQRELITIVERLIHVTVGLVAYYSLILDSDPDNAAVATRSRLLEGELRAIRNSHPSPLSKERTEDFWRNVNQLELTFQESVILQRSMTFIRIAYRKMESGIESLGSIPIHDPILIDNGLLTLNPDFVEYIIHIWNSILDSVTNRKSIGTNPFSNRLPGQRDLELFKLATMVFNENVTNILDLESGTFHVPGSRDKVHVIPKDLIQGYMQLFKFSDSISRLDTLANASRFSQPSS